MSRRLRVRIQRHCSRCGGRMRRRGLWGRDLDRWSGGFDRQTGEPKPLWYWACEHLTFGAQLAMWVDHDYRRARAPRHLPMGYWQQQGRPPEYAR